MEWWYEREGQRGGPVFEAELLSLVAHGNLTAKSLVWSDGLSGWTKLQDVPSLAAKLTAEPPPLPPELSSGAQLKQSVSPTQAYAPQKVTPTEAGNNHLVARPIKGPATWFRYFSRQIDIFLLGLPTVFLSYFILALIVSPATNLKMQDAGLATITAIALLCLLGPLTEALVSGVFGNTPGKALFGLKVQSLEGRELLFVERVKRAYRVMFYGLGCYLPFISLFTCISQFDKLKKTGSAGYDAGLFKVQEMELSGPRKFVAVSVWVLSFIALFGLNVYDKHETRRIANPKSWTNPSTLVATTIPGGWEVNSQANDMGDTIHVFTKAADAVQVIFASEDIRQDATLEDYAAAFVRGVSSDMTISASGDSAIVAGHAAMVHTGQLHSPKAPIQVTFVKSGNIFWRTVVVSLGGETFPPSTDAVRTAAFMSVPKL